MTERLSHKRDCLYKDKITRSKTHLFVLEKADYTYNYAVIRQLRSFGKLIVERKVGESAGIAAYWNGYAVYHAGRDATVFRIHACSGYCYDSGSSLCDIGSGTFDGEAWICVEKSLPNGKNTCCGRTAGHSWK